MGRLINGSEERLCADYESSRSLLEWPLPRVLQPLKLNCLAVVTALSFQPNIARNRTLAYRRISFEPNLRLQIAINSLHLNAYFSSTIIIDFFV